jgi:acyl-CoA thioesterase-1
MASRPCDRARGRCRLLFLLSVSLAVAGGCGKTDSAPAERPPRGETPAVSAAAPSAPAATARRRIVFLGDSLTAGYGLDRDQSVPSLVQTRLDQAGFDYEVVNAGVSGDTTAGGLSRLEWSLQGDVAVLVVELGANDGLRGLPVRSMKQNLDRIIRTAKARGITVLLTGMEAPPNYGASYTSEFRRVFSDLAREHKVPFIPFYLEGVAGIPTLNIADGMHPNPQGARIVEGTIWRALEPLLAKNS